MDYAYRVPTQVLLNALPCAFSPVLIDALVHILELVHLLFPDVPVPIHIQMLLQALDQFVLNQGMVRYGRERQEWLFMALARTLPSTSSTSQTAPVLATRRTLQLVTPNPTMQIGARWEEIWG